MARYKNKDREAQYEEDENEIENQNGWSEQDGEGNSPSDTPDESLNGEERTFKQRYADLRSHSHRKEQEFQNRINDLEKKLETATNQQLQLPKTEEEIEEWKKKYPEVSAIIESIAMKQSGEVKSDLDERMSKLHQKEEQQQKQKARDELVRRFPDFPKYIQDNNFHEWIKNQRDWVRQALYENDTDVDWAADAIEKYENDSGVKKKKQKQSQEKNNRQAASEVPTSNTDDPEKNGKKTWRESEVEKLSDSQYEKHEDEIMEAISQGRFTYDLSAAS